MLIICELFLLHLIYCMLEVQVIVIRTWLCKWYMIYVDIAHEKNAGLCVVCAADCVSVPCSGVLCSCWTLAVTCAREHTCATMSMSVHLRATIQQYGHSMYSVNWVNCCEEFHISFYVIWFVNSIREILFKAKSLWFWSENQNGKMIILGQIDHLLALEGLEAINLVWNIISRNSIANKKFKQSYTNSENTMCAVDLHYFNNWRNCTK